MDIRGLWQPQAFQLMSTTRLMKEENREEHSIFLLVTVFTSEILDQGK